MHELQIISVKISIFVCTRIQRRQNVIVRENYQFYSTPFHDNSNYRVFISDIKMHFSRYIPGPRPSCLQATFVPSTFQPSARIPPRTPLIHTWRRPRGGEMPREVRSSELSIASNFSCPLESCEQLELILIHSSTTSSIPVGQSDMPSQSHASGMQRLSPGPTQAHSPVLHFAETKKIQ